MWNPFSKKEIEVETINMTPDEMGVIHLYAKGEESFREVAIEIHRKYIPLIGAYNTPEQRFMSEVDTVCPDLRLRETYREMLLEDK